MPAVSSHGCTMQSLMLCCSHLFSGSILASKAFAMHLIEFAGIPFIESACVLHHDNKGAPFRNKHVQCMGISCGMHASCNCRRGA
jgi:hypothetical protein